MRFRIRTNLLALPLALGVACLGCEETKLAVFDKAAIGRIHTLMVLPLQSPQDSEAGPIVSGMIAARLQASFVDRLTIVESPVFWRLDRGGPPAGRGAMSDKAAMGVARAMGADAVLTGTVTYAVQLAAAAKMPRAMKRSMKGMDFQKDFAVRRATVSVNLRILSVRENRAVYANSVATGGQGGSQVLRQAAEKALGPFERYVKSLK